MSEWKDIKEGPPPVGKVLIVTVYDHCRRRDELRYPVYYQQKTYEDGYGFYTFGCEYLVPEVSEVIAWMPMPNVWDGEGIVEENEEQKYPFGRCHKCSEEFNSELINEYNITHCPYCGEKIR
jgi:DNA-directed RNA polymerase subunit RPC12/RpoP